MNHTRESLMAFEQRVERSWAEGNLPCLLHLAGGEEEILLDIFKHVNEGDWIFGSHRSHYIALFAGMTEQEVWGHAGWWVSAQRRYSEVCESLACRASRLGEYCLAPHRLERNQRRHRTGESRSGRKGNGGDEMKTSLRLNIKQFPSLKVQNISVERLRFWLWWVPAFGADQLGFTFSNIEKAKAIAEKHFGSQNVKWVPDKISDWEAGL